MFTDRFVARCLIVTAAMNVGAGIAAVVAPDVHARAMFAGDVHLDGVTLRYHLFVWLFVIAMGVGYGLAARRPSEQRALLVAGGLGKLVAVAIWSEMLITGIGAPLMAGGIAFDGVLGSIFLLHAWRGPRAA